MHPFHSRFHRRLTVPRAAASHLLSPVLDAEESPFDERKMTMKNMTTLTLTLAMALLAGAPNAGTPSLPVGKLTGGSRFQETPLRNEPPWILRTS